jgi:hypothetical protein
MLEPKDLSTSELKKFHKAVQEKKECAKDNKVKAESMIILRMLDEELDKRGYDVEKLFKGYKLKK